MIISGITNLEHFLTYSNMTLGTELRILTTGPHHVGAYGVDLVGPYSHHDGPFGPFGFYANFYHH